MRRGFSTSLEMLLFFRTTTFVGVCVEFVAAVAWLAELFPDPKQREYGARLYAGLLLHWRTAGDGRVHYLGALRPSLPAIHGVHEAWRYTLISGFCPRSR